MLDGCVPWPEELASRYREAGYWKGETLGSLLRQWADEYRDREALVSADGGRRITYRALDEWCDRLAAGFAAHGVAPGDRVLVQLPNTPDFVAVCFALFRLGALPVFVLPVYRDNEIEHLAELSGASAYIVPDTFNGFDHRTLARSVQGRLPQISRVFVAGEVDEPGEGWTALADVDAEPVSLAEPDASDVAFFLLSGGTTALPKLIPRTHESYAYQTRRTGEICGADASTVYLAALPVEFNFPWGCPGVIGTMQVGGRVVLADSPQPLACFPLIEREGVTLTSLNPTIIHLWLAAAEEGGAFDLGSLEVVQVASAKLHTEVAERIEPLLGVRLQQVFGMSEGLLTFTRYDDPHETVMTTQGRPVSAADEIRIVDSSGAEVAPGEVGELLTRGPYTLQGYYRSPEHNARAFTEDGFYRSGDLVRRTSGGNIVIEGRIKDVVNRGGNKVSATEIEGHLARHPDVQQAAVVAMPDPVLGEKVCAYVIAAPGRSAPKLPVLRELLRSRGLASFKLPDRVEAVDSFPLTGLNKIDKKVLRARIADKLERLARQAA
ncbi:2,3-dihydroxybenzoate-AMP ligase [Streptomyces sp. YIM 130001]|uniref:(2,3-dihydroxybenzoyl)adenylate synthase n=1 Tax=Streptomyces sp. YIM 130001 TaxID=2259644 RepID=UPI000E64CA1E|nr:AMP-binding protein [Streptomyces sp. YIM 130001]RII13450.1 2,3-dihydroxybenzoate-AMP ligase [Streptomyces sp. YIM 130001]